MAHKRPLAIAAISACSLALVTACSSSPSTSAGSSNSKSPYEIGFESTLSGPIAFAGEPTLQGFENYIGAVNSQGGVNGRKIKIVTADDRFDTATGLAQYRSLASQGALAVFGMVDSGPSVAIAKVAPQVQVPLIGAGVLPPTNDWTFISTVENVWALSEGVPLVKFLAKQMNLPQTKIALVVLDTPAGQASVPVFQKAIASDPGLRIASTVYNDTSPTSFATQAAQIAAEKPNIVFTEDAAAAMLVIVPALRQAGVTAPIINYQAGAGEAMLRQLNDPDIYVMRDYADPSEPAAAPMRASAQKQGMSDGTNQVLGGYYTEGYVEGELAASVLKACGADCTGQKFDELLQTSASKIDTEGLSAPVQGFSTTNHAFLDQVRYLKWNPSAKGSEPVVGCETGGPNTGCGTLSAAGS
jgi:branched-chain amino acid transport system substrate-binding protein